MMTLRHGNDPVTPNDEGAAMILVIIWSTVLLIMSMAVGQVVVNQVRPSDRNEQSYKAWTAAEAGVDIFKAHLAANPDYFKVMTSTTDPALKQFVDVPGMASSAQYRYFVKDSSNAARAGELTLVSTGRSISDGTERTVEVTMRKRSPYEYAYLSNYETIPWDYPDAYSVKNGDDGKPLASQSQVASDGTLYQAGAYYFCQDRFWRTQSASQPPVLSPPSTLPAQPWHRNSLRCKSVAITSDQRWYGDIHTNDTWYFNTGTTSKGTFDEVFSGGTVTTSCTTDGTDATCPEDHRYIDSLWLAQNSGKISTTDPYLRNEAAVSVGPIPVNPLYESVLELPPTNRFKIRDQAVKDPATSPTNWGCLYSGITRISFYGDTIYVTSPDTRDTNPRCTGAANTRAGLRGTLTTPQSQYTAVLSFADMVANGFNGVFYVQDVPGTDTGTGSIFDLNSLPKWGATGGSTKKLPTCTEKGSGSSANFYPFVIPANAQGSYAGANSEAYLFSSSTYNGFPVEATKAQNANKLDWWSTPIQERCDDGTVYLQGTYQSTDAAGLPKGLMVVAEGDAVITDDLRDINVPNTDPATRLDPNYTPVYGVPATTSKNVLGLVPVRYLYVYHPPSAEGGNGWADGYLRDIILNFATVVLEKCLSVQQYDSVPQMGSLTFVGSLAQKYRCNVKAEAGANGQEPSTGYTTFTVRYDDRFRSLVPPPFMMELSAEPWRTLSQVEVHSSSVVYPVVP